MPLKKLYLYLELQPHPPESHSFDHTLHLHSMRTWLLLLLLGVPEKVKDVVFLVGGTSPYHYNTAMRLLPEIAQQQQTSNTMFALIRYADTANLEVPFQNKDNFTSAITKVYWIGKGDTLKEGLELVPRVFNDYGRPDAQRVLVVFASAADDTTRDELLEVYKKLKKNGVKVVPVVIGESADGNNLAEIHPKKQRPLNVKPDDDPEESSNKISEDVFKGECMLLVNGPEEIDL